MTRPRPLPDGLADRAFRRRDLDDRSIWFGRVRARDIVHAYHGVYAVDPPETLRERCRVYAARLRPGQVFSHETAALLHGMPLPGRLEAETPLHVAAVRPASPPRTRGVLGHRLVTPPVLVPVDDLPVCAPSEAWIQLADRLTLDELIVLADHLLTVSPLDEDVTRRLLAKRIADSRRRTASQLRAALAEARCPVLSPGETRIRLLLIRAGIPAPEVNGPVFTEAGAYLGKPDLVWRANRVGLEYEGGRHLAEEQVLYDIGRRETFEDHGWHIIRASRLDLVDEASRAALVDRVRRRLAVRR